MRYIRLSGVLNYWGKLTNGSVNRKILGAAFTVGFLTAFVKLAAFAKELVVAWRFGTGDEIDAFLIAFVIPSFIVNVVAASFSSALLPTYIQVLEKEGVKSAKKLFYGVMFCCLILLVITTIIVIATAPIYLPWLASGFSPQKLELTFNLLCGISPFIVLSGMIYIWEAILNSGERFALAAFVPILTPSATIIFLLSVKSWGIFALAAGLVFSVILEVLILGVALHRQGISLLPKWYGFDSNLRQVFHQYLPMLAGAFLLCSAIPIDQAMAAMLSPGSVATLNYGNRIIASPMSLITTALTAAVMPYCSQMVAREDWIGISRTLRKYLKLILLITVPLMIFFIIFSQPIIELVFQRGNFTTEDIASVAVIQSFYALQIPFYIGNLLLIRLMSSLQKNHVLMWVSGLDLIVNIFLNYLFIQWIGIKGIALSTSFVYIFSFFYLFNFAHNYLQDKCNLQNQ